MILSVVARIFSAIVSLYMVACAVRIFILWAPGFNSGKIGVFLARITDPYLRFFSRYRFLHTERFDFSPIVALAVLSVLNNMLLTIAYVGRITIGFVLSLILGAGWSALAFILIFLAVCAFLRVLVIVLKWNSSHPIWIILDSILNPTLRWINGIIYRHRSVDYLQALVTGFIVLILLRAGGGAIIKLLSSLLVSLPF
jgi:YggT family protein